MRTIIVAAVLLALPSMASAQGRTAGTLEAAPTERVEGGDTPRGDSTTTDEGRRDGQEERYMEIVGTDGRLAGVRVINMIQSSDPEAPAADFVARADRNGDGYLDREELEAAGFDVSGDGAETMTIRATIDVVYQNAGQ